MPGGSCVRTLKYFHPRVNNNCCFELGFMLGEAMNSH